MKNRYLVLHPYGRRKKGEIFETRHSVMAYLERNEKGMAKPMLIDLRTDRRVKLLGVVNV